MDPLRSLSNRVKNMLARMVVKLVDDSVKMQLIQASGLLMDDSQEVRAGIERFQNYGFTSVPLEGAEAAVLFLEGRRDHGIAVVVDDRRYRLKGLQNGEVAIYTDQGDSIVIKRGGTVEVTAATAIHLGGSSHDVALADKVLTELNKLKTAFDAHTHGPGTLTSPSGPVTGLSGAGPSSAALSSPGSTLVKAGS